MIVSLLLNLAILVIPSIVVWNQIIFYLFGKKDIYINAVNGFFSLPKLSIIVPTKGEKIEIIQGLIDNLYKAKWDKSKMEIIIVSDDDEKYFNELVKSLVIPSDLNVKIFRREKKLGYKSGALTYGFEKSSGDLILTLDVDARISEDSLIKAYSQMVTLGCDVITMEWHGYSSNPYSFLAKALMVFTVLTSQSILRGRDKLGLKVLPIGCGTIYKREVLEKVNAWDYTMIQDDYELGARLINKGFRICASSSPVFVEVPDNLISFYVQQSRWAMGTIEVLIRRFKFIIKSRIKFYQKIEIIIYLLQYIPIILTFLGALALTVFSFLDFKCNLYLPLFIFWALTLSIYVYIFLSNAKKMGLNYISAVKALGRLSAYTVAISPFLLINTLKAFKKVRTYIVTPKGKKAKSNIGYPILVFGTLFIFSSIVYLLHDNLLIFIWLLYYSVAYLYTFVAFIKGL